ncbi:hypothetical protein SAMN05660328_101515 [Streptococcus gallolyticus]|uniref:Glycosyltransferase 2-like domain-containing protein n=1 Tax=Streptococcus gallolyticus TaxID=315405 RepID=A0A1I7FPP7_9STRE|nr:glycosyltransferase family 2 protein [Streptococcus gallolyticus]SFC11334.1 hypothetical protein SAMN02983012_0664 [Streptococcus gallolyticus]SFU38108.1 hypothetical protein SAMN05660328_101515 [Streptococcus gallolyticus]
MLNELSVIILNYNSFDDTYKCVNQLLSFTADFKIIIVDNNSSDNSLKRLKSEYGSINQVVILTSDKNGGYSYGNNYGINYAQENYSSKYIAILNPDVIIPECNVFERMLKVLVSDVNYAMIGGMAITDGEFVPNKSAWPIPNNLDVFWERSLLNPRRNHNNFNMIDTTLAQVDCVAGCFFIIKSDIFYDVGLFDENVFLYNEENILGIKLKREGYKSLVSTNSFYYHNHKKGRDNNTPLSKKIKSLLIRYISRKYLITKYYNTFLVLPLFLTEFLNAIQIILGHFKRKIFRDFTAQSEQ